MGPVSEPLMHIGVEDKRDVHRQEIFWFARD